MKNLVKTVVFSTLLASIQSCGSETSTKSELEAEAKRTEESIISGVSATQDTENMVLVTGKIWTGTNRCMAAGVRATLKQKKQGKDLLLVPTITNPKVGRRICTREFDPQQAFVTAKVNLNKVAGQVRVMNVEGFNLNVNLLDLLTSFPEQKSETMIENMVVERWKHTEGSDERALEVRGRIMLGSNPCAAQNVTAKMISEREGDTLIIKVILTSPASTLGQFCTREFNPVYVDLSLPVRYSLSNTKSIVVRNVDGMEQHVEINP